MRVRAVIFDIYQTLLHVGPPPPDARERWEFLWEDKLAAPARLSLEEFAGACEALVAREHAAARPAGIPYPEIYWPDIAREALPELTRLTSAECNDFLFEHAQLQRTVHLMPDAAGVVRALARAGIPMGIASNAQPYTLREFSAALAAASMGQDCFRPDLSFWSFLNGFSKPDPHVFRLLTARLAAKHIRAEEILMIGDRLDNDILPAKAQNWQTWQIVPEFSSESGSGTWSQLAERLSGETGGFFLME
jgi:putative hydrolase of the HAD superfamily